MTNNGPSINTWNQSGGNNTINVGPTKLIFDQAIAEELVSKLPSENQLGCAASARRTIRLSCLSTSNSSRVAVFRLYEM